ncbi:MAG TPA: aspartyl protease family protein [Steroidobacteraceae bacterium]|nr:aspartyl protease family protein [Steroidobacteraceae bacterium]
MTSVAGVPAFGACQLDRIAQFTVNMAGLRPTIAAKINGTDAIFAVDSGAFFSMISPAAAKQLGLRLDAPPRGLRVSGVGGPMQYSVATVDFRLDPFHFPRMDFIVGGNEIGGGAQGALGENFLRAGDAEYDFANGTMRLMRPGAGCNQANLAYWAAKDQAISVLPIDNASPRAPWARGIAYLNGQKIRVIFDTGSPLSMLSVRAAGRAGVKPADPGVTAIGYMFGVGQSAVRSWIAPFDSFKLGGEEIRHTHLRIVDFASSNVDMYIGADFFLSHHVYVANSQHRLYFTYNGGPVFNLTAYAPGTRANATAPSADGAALPVAKPAAPAQAAPPPRAAANALVALQAASAPSDSAEAKADATRFARRGAALAARGEFQGAIADLTRACQLDPREPSCFEQRGVAELRSGQPLQAESDFDQAIRLKPNDVTALLARAQLRFRSKDREGAVSDLESVDSDLAPEADERLALGDLYLHDDEYAAAIKQYSLWLGAHGNDVALPSVLNQRCWARALADQDLKEALADCDRAIRASRTPPMRADALDSRGFVRLRLGDFARSIKDYDDALRILPRLPSSLFGRGIDELRQGRTAAGSGDVHSAEAEQPQVADVFRRVGISP